MQKLRLLVAYSTVFYVLNPFNATGFFLYLPETEKPNEMG